MSVRGGWRLSVDVILSLSSGGLLPASSSSVSIAAGVGAAREGWLCTKAISPICDVCDAPDERMGGVNIGCDLAIRSMTGSYVREKIMLN